MKIGKLALGVAAISIAALAAPIAGASACPNQATPPSELTAEEGRDAVICLINQRRSHRGVQALRADSRLEQAALGHSSAMDTQNFFSHAGDGSPVSRARRAGYMEGARAWKVGENLRWGIGRRGTPMAVVAEWMSSPSHRAVVLTRSFRHLGVGVVFGSPVGAGGGNAAIYTTAYGFRR